MRRWLLVLASLVAAASLLFSTGCKKQHIKDSPEEEEPQPGPRPPPGPGAR